MKLYIKNMVCNRCKMVVESELVKAGLNHLSVGLGEIEIEEELSHQQQMLLNEKIKPLGFELIDDRKSKLADKVKTLIVELIYSKDNDLKVNLSAYIASAIGQDYSHISNVFSQKEGITIEHYYILQKIERVKELLVYNELSLNEIATMLNYSSASHLTNQFKKVTGLTPSFFKSVKDIKRKALDNL
jgi:AraC-like DNA-binding protein